MNSDYEYISETFINNNEYIFIMDYEYKSNINYHTKMGVIYMPRFDGTGPYGQGPMTGRGMGPCGRGQGFGRGFGRGRRMGFCPWIQEPLTKEEEKKMLEEEKKFLEQRIKEIEAYLKEE